MLETQRGKSGQSNTIERSPDKECWRHRLTGGKGRIEAAYSQGQEICHRGQQVERGSVPERIGWNDQVDDSSDILRRR